MDKKQIFIGVGIISVALLVYYHFHNATNTGASQTLVSSATALSPSQQTANAAIPAAGLSTNATGGIGGFNSPNGSGIYGTFNQVGPGLVSVSSNGNYALYEPLGQPSAHPTVAGV